ncbi:MAG TPA: hypothetical protein VGP92_12575 [Acidimicrobiia bacterium]|nr:hypothetical protein [Acidimicrobiia bacterium]
MKWRGERAKAALMSTAALVAVAGMGFGTTASAAGAANAPTGVKVIAATIGTRSLMQPTRANPVVINPKQSETLLITVRNDGSSSVAIRYLRLSGSLIGVRFVRYQASAKVDVAPGATKSIAVPGDFFDIDGVASGYISATMQVVDQNRKVLASQPFVADVQGKVASSVGLLLLQAFLFAAIGIVEIVVGLARRRLPRNRFVRALLFALTALSIVVTIVVAAAMSRVALFGASTWVPALLVATAIGFVLGYLSPGRLDRRDRETPDDIDLVAAEAVARASGGFDSVTTGSVAAHESGDHTGATVGHESGDHTGAVPSHHSGEHVPPPSHESGGFEPLA